MSNQQIAQQKSRLGTLLLHRGLITRTQLDAALRLQAESQLKLGEILIEQGWLTENDLNKALKKQSRYRLFAAVSAALLGPMQPFISTAHAAIDDSVVAEAFMAKRSGLVPMSEADMGNVSAQGLRENVGYLSALTDASAPNDEAGEKAVMATLESLFPGLNLLSDYEISGVEYHNSDTPMVSYNDDGSMNIKLPKRIAEIAFRDLNIAGGTGPAMGDLLIKDLRMSADSSITIKVNN